MKKIFGILLIASLCSCLKETQFEVNGKTPVYLGYEDFSTLKSLPPQPFVNAGKIVTKGNFIFINEYLKGIHIIDNSDPNLPKNIGFIQVLGNSTFTIVEDVLYADNGKHLLLIDIADFSNVKFITYIKDQYINSLEPRDEYPKDYIGWFECYDIQKGILLDWQDRKLTNPACEKKF